MPLLVKGIIVRAAEYCSERCGRGFLFLEANAPWRTKIPVCTPEYAGLILVGIAVFGDAIIRNGGGQIPL